jgi:hypothetical protein
MTIGPYLLAANHSLPAAFPLGEVPTHSAHRSGSHYACSLRPHRNPGVCASILQHPAAHSLFDSVPKQNKYISMRSAAKQTDRQDAQLILRLMLKDDFPQISLPLLCFGNGLRRHASSGERAADLREVRPHCVPRWLPCCLPPQERSRHPVPSAFRSSIARPTDTSVYASSVISRYSPQDSRPGWIRCFLSCRALSSPTTCRFSPALSCLPTTRVLAFSFCCHPRGDARKGDEETTH